LNTLLSDNQDSSTIPLILKSIHELLPYFLSFRRLMKETINTVVDVAGRANTDDNSRLAAFSFLNSSAEAYRKSLLEIILKSTYSGIVKVSRRTTAHTMPLINMLKNSTVTLYSIDPVISYQQGFQFIRQLAIHLRSSITNKTAESYKTVYNWQYLHSLDFWSRVLCYQCDLSKESLAGKASPLRELIHPLVQVTLGAMRLIPTPQYFPLRFYSIRSLIRLSRQTGVYIPLLPTLTETLASTTISKKAKASTLKPLDFDYSFRAGKSYLGTRVYQDGVSEQFVDLTGEFFVLYCKSIAFPELSIPAIITLKRFIKRSSNIKFNKQLQRLLEKIDENSNFILQHRNNVSFGPCDKEQVAAFLKDFDWEKTPLGEYRVVQRKIKEEKARLLRESLEEDEGKNLDQDIDMESEIEVESEEDEEAEEDEDDD
jgi:nucleolar complex protein 2